MDDERPDNQGRQPGGARSPAGGRRRASQHLDLDALNAYLDWGLGDAERRAVAAHLAGCPDCRRELAQLRATVGLLRGLPQYAPRRSFRLGPEHATAGTRSGGWATRLLPALPALRAATSVVAILLLLVTAGDLVSNRSDDEAAEPPASSTLAEDDADQAAGAAVTDQPSGAPAAEPDAAVPGTGSGSGASTTAGEAQTAQETAPAAPRQLAEDAGQRRAVAADAERAALADEAGASPAAGAGGIPQSPAVAASAEQSGDGGPGDGAERDRPSAWRLAQVGLGLLLLWLLVGLIGVQRLRRT